VRGSGCAKGGIAGTHEYQEVGGPAARLYCYGEQGDTKVIQAPLNLFTVVKAGIKMLLALLNKSVAITNILPPW
jgi:hypothetical protein